MGNKKTCRLKCSTWTILVNIPQVTVPRFLWQQTEHMLQIISSQLRKNCICFTWGNLQTNVELGTDPAWQRTEQKKRTRAYFCVQWGKVYSGRNLQRDNSQTNCCKFWTHARCRIFVSAEIARKEVKVLVIWYLQEKY